MTDYICYDYETEAIEARPVYPPKPVGVAIRWPGEKSRYYAWGHSTGNNCTESYAAEALAKVWASGLPLLAQNHKFELDISETHFGLPRLPWERIHDSMFLLFLKDPHSNTISLKPAAERYLDLPPEEQDAVADWLRTYGVITAAQRPGAFISQAPGDIVAPYACGDVDRTKALFDLLYPQILEAGMGAAYDRERKLLPILLDNERAGINVDVNALKVDLGRYEKSLSLVEKWIEAKLRSGGLNFDADAEVAEALAAAGFVTEWTLTPTGRRSTAKKNLKINDPEVALALDYRNRLQNVMAQSMRPWLIQASHNGGRIFTEWNQVRTSRGSDTAGTRTGRLSCARFMNIAKAFSTATPAIRGCLPLPLVRRYLLPDAGGVWAGRDFSSQELRILAHYEDGEILAEYQRNPTIDYHSMMVDRVKESTGVALSRKDAKTINFGILYGMGLGTLADSLKVDIATAMTLRDAVRKASPGVQSLDRELKRRASAGEPLRTWGGRVYFCEPDGPEGQSYAYKMLNVLVQGSAADATKEAIIRYDAAKKHGRFLVSVHDEIAISAPKKHLASEMRILKECMESIEFDVKQLTEGYAGPSWGEIKERE